MFTLKEVRISQSQPVELKQEVGQANSVLFSTGNAKYVLINTVMVYMKDSCGLKRPFREILDSAAQSNFVTYEAARALGISKQKVSVPICGLNNSTLQVKSKIAAELSDGNDKSKLIVPKITDMTPPAQLNVTQIRIPVNITLADPEF